METKEEIQKKLNKEYELIGTIEIQNISSASLKIESIVYLKKLISKIKPLNSEQPIIVYKHFKYEDKYILLDGYHRLKSALLKNKQNINVYIIDGFKIKRRPDSLYSFMESLVGKTIRFIDSNTLAIDNRYYSIDENEGCGGCNNGWSSIEVLPEFIEKDIKVKTICDKTDDKNSDKYELFINNNKVADVDTGWGNGYYGGDFEITINI